MPPSRRDIAAEQVLAKAKAVCEIADDRDVGPGLALRRHNARAHLNLRLRVSTQLEPNAQRLGLERAGDGQNDSGKLGRE
jgi:hypothetical protein